MTENNICNNHVQTIDYHIVFGLSITNLKKLKNFFDLTARRFVHVFCGAPTAGQSPERKKPGSSPAENKAKMNAIQIERKNQPEG